jgi:hypothetical protein
MSARDRIAADLAAICRRLDQCEQDGTPCSAADVEALSLIGERAAASGGRAALNRLARPPGSIHLPHGELGTPPTWKGNDNE